MNRPLNRILPRVTGSASVWTWIKWSLLAALVIAIAIIARVVQTEIETSRLQAHYLSELTRDVGYTVETGPSDHIRFPANGPYDERLGYSMIPAFQQRLLARGFVVSQQARDSDRMLSLADHGLFLPYDEKDQTGLMLFDSTGAPLFTTVFPQRVYADFDSVPPLVANSLMFIEDRYLLDPTQPNRNPAIDWGRFSRALADQAMHVVNHHQARPGGSTLATQIEKFRHSPNGRTATPPEKLRQIASASILAYMNGPQTMLARRTVLVRYLNSVPLAARPHIGEITGIGDGLAAWYGRDFNDVNRILSAPTTGDNVDEQGKTFREVLSLIIAQRAPSYFLNRGYPALQKLTDSYLRLLSGGGVISPALRDAALAAQIERSAPPAAAHVQSFVSRKAVTSARASLLSVLGISDLYQLDQLDLQATSTLDNGVQQAVAQRLAQASTRDGAQAAGLYGFEMLAPKDDPSHLTYSFTLYEHRNGANLLRVQTDSVNEPFDVNRGGRINLGSTAKLRTLITYLQIMSDLHARYAGLSNAQLAQVKPDPIDALSRWALDYLSHTRDHSLQAMLDAAVERKYSASPNVFYTGGGAQVFSNFDKSDNGRIMTLHTAFEHSVNLVFVRLMRDIVHYEMLKAAGPSSSWLDDPEQRRHYLAQFVDSESQVYVKRYYTRYAGKAPDAALALMLQDVRKSPPKIATVLRSVAPNESLAWFDAQMRAQLKGTPAASLSDDDLAALYAKYAIDRFNLNDRGYIASVHPLALWTLNYLRAHPSASLADVQRDSHDARFYTYSWLYKTRYHATQDRRIRRMVELRAYAEITKAWRALGYPFANVTPSYAAAIGASGDQPDALAKLIGLIANNGEKAPTETITRLDFANGTPYETRFVRAAAQPQPTLSPEIVNVARTLLRDVVLNGTGRRLAGGLTLPDGKTLAVYGKTGTGDQRFNVYARGARLIESRKVNRSGTFVFVLGDRFFGVLTATAHEPYAARYDFTSAMAVQLLKTMAPALAPLIERPVDAGTRTAGPAPQAEMPTPRAAPVEPS